MIESAIITERLLLVPMSAPFFKACLASDLVTAAALLNATVPAEWLASQALMELRLRQLQRNPALQPWLLRAMVHRESNTMIGHIGCHDGPGATYLQRYTPAGIEIGYTTFFAHRRRGYAREALGGLIHWAHTEQNVDQFVLSISPHNGPSLRLAAHFDFVQKGTEIDDEDGPEDVYVLSL